VSYWVHTYKVLLGETCPQKPKDIRIELIPDEKEEEPDKSDIREFKKAILETLNRKSTMKGWKTCFEEYHAIYKIFNPDEGLMH
jgi:hypothetical protein